MGSEAVKEGMEGRGEGERGGRGSGGGEAEGVAEDGGAHFRKGG